MKRSSSLVMNDLPESSVRCINFGRTLMAWYTLFQDESTQYTECQRNLIKVFHNEAKYYTDHENAIENLIGLFLVIVDRLGKITIWQNNFNNKLYEIIKKAWTNKMLTYMPCPCSRSKWHKWKSDSPKYIIAGKIVLIKIL